MLVQCKGTFDVNLVLISIFVENMDVKQACFLWIVILSVKSFSINLRLEACEIHVAWILVTLTTTHLDKGQIVESSEIRHGYQST